MISFKPKSPYPLERAPVSVEKELGWASELE